LTEAALELLYRAEMTKMRALVPPYITIISISKRFQRKGITPSIPLLDHPEPGSRRHLERVGMRLSKLAFSTSHFTWNDIGVYRHLQRAQEFGFHAKTVQLRPP
jgi:hypothetical protein